MIIKGTSRGGPRELGAYLSSQGQNEWIAALEVKGTIASNVADAILEMDALAAGTRCEKPLYHAMINPAPPHILTPEQRLEAIEALEQKLGFEGHARVVVIHEKKDRQHIHVVWSRIDLAEMKAVPDSWNYVKHEQVARDLERRFGHERVQGAHHERDGIERPDRTPSRPELRQEERTGISGKEVKAEVTAAFRGSDGPEAFKAALEDAGYLLAQGDRRDFVVLDAAGGVHSLARRIEGVSAAQLREFMSPLDRSRFPTVEQAQEVQFDRAHGLQSARDEERWNDALATAAIEKDLHLSDDERRRLREARAGLWDDRIEAAYARGDGYVSQSRAAQKDHKRRQARLDHRGEEDGRERVDADRRRDEDRRKRQDEQSQAEPSRSASTALDSIEMTDAMQERLDRLFEAAGDFSLKPEEPDRQLQASGEGRSRSR